MIALDVQFINSGEGGGWSETHLHGQIFGGGDASVGAAAEAARLAQTHLQLPQVPAAIHRHQLHTHKSPTEIQQSEALCHECLHCST